ncbi:MAG: competence protein ComE, partial [Tolypothrix sp. Co-bin9]|nr:competence protein ComE [Tolypothrix sp. Co-bin9]
MQIFSTQRRFYFIFLLILTLAGCQRVHFHSKRLQPLPQDLLVKVYFNHSKSSEYKEPYRQQTRLGDDLEKQIVDAISQAKSTVDVAVQELRLPKVAEALVDRQKAGVKVRLILENTYSRSWSSFSAAEVGKLKKREKERYHEFKQFVDINKDNQLSLEEINQRDALAILRNAKVPIVDDIEDGSAGSDLMHHKFVIVDNRIVIVTSANFTLSDIHGDYSNNTSLGNANNLLNIDSPELAALFTKEFNIMCGDGQAGKLDSKFGLKKPIRLPEQITLGETKITVQFSPTSPTQPW